MSTKQCELKNILDGINNRLNIKEEKIIVLKDIIIETIQNETQHKTKI